jgi:hypothetical protein
MSQYIKSMKPKIPIVSMMYYQTHKAKIELYVNPPWPKWLAPYVGQVTIKLVILWLKKKFTFMQQAKKLVDW